MKAQNLLILTLLFIVSCTRGDARREKIGTREILFPDTFRTSDAADGFVQGRFGGGRVDEVTVGAQRYLIAFQHGSGFPVIGIAVYEQRAASWKLVQESRPPGKEFLGAEVSGQLIVVVGRNSKQTWRLFEAK